MRPSSWSHFGTSKLKLVHARMQQKGIGVYSKARSRSSASQPRPSPVIFWNACGDSRTKIIYGKDFWTHSRLSSIWTNWTLWQVMRLDGAKNAAVISKEYYQYVLLTTKPNVIYTHILSILLVKVVVNVLRVRSMYVLLCPKIFVRFLSNFLTHINCPLVYKKYIEPNTFYIFFAYK